MGVGGQVKQGVAESEEPVQFDGTIGRWESTLMDLEGEKVKRLDISNGSNKMEAVVMAAAQNGLGGNGGDEMASTAALQDWIFIRRRQKQDKIMIRQRQQ